VDFLKKKKKGKLECNCVMEKSLKKQIIHTGVKNVKNIETHRNNDFTTYHNR
jgi:hypothetical protein